MSLCRTLQVCCPVSGYRSGSHVLVAEADVTPPFDAGMLSCVQGAGPNGHTTDVFQASLESRPPCSSSRLTLQTSTSQGRSDTKMPAFDPFKHCLRGLSSSDPERPDEDCHWQGFSVKVHDV